MIRILNCTCLFLLLLLGCKDKNYGWKLSHSEILKNCDKIIIRSQKEVDAEYGTTFIPDSNVIFEIKGKQQLNNFRSLFDKNERTGYCCCPEANFRIQFYNTTDNFIYYNVDTVESKSRIRIYHPGFQYSYLIDRIVWDAYLSELNR